MTPKISVIVPVYNTESYLKTCLNSLLNQSLRNFEIIIVNDGSTDDSQKVINEYSKRYPSNIISINKENKGPGPARNDGIKLARGTYLAFVDSDDWVHPEMLEALYRRAAQGHDFILCDYVEVRDGHKYVLKGFTGNVFGHRQAVMYSTDAAFSCNKLIKKSLFEALMFPDGWYEDLATLPILLSNACSPAYINVPLYYYKIRSDSITSSNDIRTLGVIRAWERLLSQGNPRFKQELVFAAARNISSFLQFKPQYAGQFMAFAKDHQDIIAKNIYYQEAIRQGKLKDLFLGLPNTVR